ncbi:hypothetical protein BFJ72_g12076 [Fusarium proliferatum]|uniref:Amino acid permease/ SLC12A domain-containing protein n=1 Tax=Gibberella intermedia TaxID=948311 RepID=A0A420SIR9_GIBIN|nr:hypothetical protein BFJ72_g12076 [Fusarium proliferatum]
MSNFENREQPMSSQIASRPNDYTVNSSGSTTTGNANNSDITSSAPPEPPGSWNGSIANLPTELAGQSTKANPENEKRLRRKLTPFQLFVCSQLYVKYSKRSRDQQMITINGTLGAGLYVRSGQILELAGPLAVILPFIGIGILALLVMLCMTELLCLWPVEGALPVFVAKFVDKELGKTVAIAYWFTYAMGFSALISICVSTIGYWLPDMPLVGHVTFYCLFPVILLAVNCFEIGVYGLIEAVTGVIKLTMLVIIIISVIIIVASSEMNRTLKTEWEQPSVYDKDAAIGFVPAFIMTVPIATFAFTGVEIIAASIGEAKWEEDPSAPKDAHSSRAGEPEENGNDPNTENRPNDVRVGENQIWDAPKSTMTIRMTAAVIPIIIGAAYIISGALVAVGLSRSDTGLPRLSWTETGSNSSKSISSPFTLIAAKSAMNYLEHIFASLFIWLLLKAWNWKRPWFTKLSDDEIVEVFEDLRDLRIDSLMRSSAPSSAS